MDLEIEIPIWYKGKMKWISNLTTRSICSDVIQAILSTDDNNYNQTNDEYILYESWRGVERPLKGRCRLLKLWNSWAGESQNVTLTLRTNQTSSTKTTSTHLLLRQQDKKLEKLKRQLKRTDKQIDKFSSNETTQHHNHHSSISPYLNLYRSIINTQTQLEYQQKLISRLISEIEYETRDNINPDELTKLLSNVHHTLIISRELTEQSEELDQQIIKINEDIDRKQYLLDELELDCALDQNIDIDSLEDDDDYPNQNNLLKQERVSTKETSLSPVSILIPPKTQIGKWIEEKNKHQNVTKGFFKINEIFFCF